MHRVDVDTSRSSLGHSEASGSSSKKNSGVHILTWEGGREGGGGGGGGGGGERSELDQ